MLGRRIHILSGTGVCTLSPAVVVPYLDCIPNTCIELLFFLLAALEFYKHVIETQRALPGWDLVIVFQFFLETIYCIFFCRVNAFQL
jgi:hypothetical protein